jgi:hypothetical protein
LPHGLNRSGGVPKPDGLASGDGSTGDDDGGAARVDGMVSVRGTSGPWGRPHGPTEMRAIR